MRHFCIRLSIALFTFFVGIVLTSVLLAFTKIPDIEVISDNFDSQSGEIYPFQLGEIDIQYFYTLSSKEMTGGIFVVTNKSKESIYYSGYDKNSHVDNWVNQNGKVTMATKLSCYNGVEVQELKPQETAMFEIPVPRNKKPYDAGFVFMKSKNRDSQTVWIKVNESNIFTQNKSFKNH